MEKIGRHEFAHLFHHRDTRDHIITHLVAFAQDIQEIERGDSIVLAYEITKIEISSFYDSRGEEHDKHIACDVLLSLTAKRLEEIRANAKPIPSLTDTMKNDNRSALFDGVFSVN